MPAVSESTLRLLSCSALRGIGPAALKKISSVPGFVTANPLHLAEHVPALKKVLAVPGAWEGACEVAHAQIRAAEADGARIISGLDLDYPSLLLQTSDDPFLLFVKGKLAPTPEKAVAIIGTREPTAHGVLIAERIAGFFASNEWSIVSGLAIGCDAIAHKTALERGAHTVAVLAHGLQTIAPSRHKDLAQQILDAGGALVTEYRYGQGIQKQQYVKRDRIQAGMARGVVMIQSDLVGGSLHASRASVEYGRWLAVPVPTERDKENGEPKVQANLRLANGDDRARAELLRCPPSALRRIFVIRSKEDYAQLLTREPVQSNRAESSSARGSSEEPPAAVEEERVKQDEGEALLRALAARYQYVRLKIREVETLQQCLFDPTTSVTPLDLDHELETLLLHMDRFAEILGRHVASESVIDASGRLRRDIAALIGQLNPVVHRPVTASALTPLFVVFKALAEAALNRTSVSGSEEPFPAELKH